MWGTSGGANWGAFRAGIERTTGGRLGRLPHGRRPPPGPRGPSGAASDYGCYGDGGSERSSLDISDFHGRDGNGGNGGGNGPGGLDRASWDCGGVGRFGRRASVSVAELSRRADNDAEGFARWEGEPGSAPPGDGPGDGPPRRSLDSQRRSGEDCSVGAKVGHSLPLSFFSSPSRGGCGARRVYGVFGLRFAYALTASCGALVGDARSARSGGAGRTSA